MATATDTITEIKMLAMRMTAERGTNVSQCHQVCSQHDAAHTHICQQTDFFCPAAAASLGLIPYIDMVHTRNVNTQSGVYMWAGSAHTK